jgi:hypothetical protein
MLKLNISETSQIYMKQQTDGWGTNRAITIFGVDLFCKDVIVQ